MIRAKNKQFLSLILFFIALCVMELLVFITQKSSSIVVYPAESFRSNLYSDNSVGEGTSSIDTSRNSNGLTVEYALADTYKWPYAGIRFNSTELLDLSTYDSLTLTVSVDKEYREIIAFWSEPIVVDDDSTSEQPFHYDISFFPNQDRYTIPLNEFQTPPWWLTEFDVAQNALPAERFQHITGIGVRSGVQAKNGEVRAFTLTSIVLTKDSRPLYRKMIFSFVGAILLFVFIVMIKRKSGGNIVIPLKELQLDEENNPLLPRIVKVIGEECDNADLSLRMVADLCETTESEISKSIKGAFRCNFKSYVNLVRIELAISLLTSSTLSVKEIAFKSGYKNSSHFFCVFRSYHNTSPAEYRKSHKKRSKQS